MAQGFKKIIRSIKGGDALVAGWQAADDYCVLWLRCGGRTLALCETPAGHADSERRKVVAALREAGADDVIVVGFPVDGLASLAGAGQTAPVREIVGAARLARGSAGPSQVETVGFEMSVAGRNLRQGDTLRLPWSGSAARLTCGGRSLLLCALPTSVIPHSDLRKWQREVADKFGVAEVFVLPCWIADWGDASPLTPEGLYTLARSKTADTPNLSWRRLQIRTSAREVEPDRLSDALDLTRNVEAPKAAPSRQEFADASPETLAYFAQAELTAAQDRSSRFLDVVHLTLGSLHYSILPGFPVEALARRLLARMGEDVDIRLVTACAGGGVLSAWALYRQGDYETQAAFLPHSIATGDYLVKACTQLANEACDLNPGPN